MENRHTYNRPVEAPFNGNIQGTMLQQLIAAMFTFLSRWKGLLQSSRPWEPEKYTNGYPPGSDIPPNGKAGKSSTQKYLGLGICDRSQEGKSWVGLGCFLESSPVGRFPCEDFLGHGGRISEQQIFTTSKPGISDILGFYNQGGTLLADV